MYQRYVIKLTRAGIGACVALAAASTAVWYLLTVLSDLAGGTDVPVPTRWDELPAWLLSWSSGAFYAVLVLFRYLDPHAAPWRPIVVGFAGALSYWIGVQYAAVLRPSESSVFDTATAGAVTAAFLGYVMIRLGILRFGYRQFAALCAAGGVGGAVIGWAAPPGYHYEPAFAAGHAAWQILTCVALYYSPKSALPAGSSPESCLPESIRSGRVRPTQPMP